MTVISLGGPSRGDDERNSRGRGYRFDGLLPQNDLQIQVTNLWPNRLIGDKQLPPDAEYADNHIKAWPQWPQWLLGGKDSPLLDSSLLGSVQVRFGNRSKVTQ